MLDIRQVFNVDRIVYLFFGDYAQVHINLAPSEHFSIINTFVGAVDKRLRLASFTGRNPDRNDRCNKPELLAPGADICAASPYSRRAVSLDSTSQATAFVTGVLALLSQACPTATPSHLEEALFLTAKPVNKPSGDRYRFGLIQPVPALALLTNHLERLPTSRSLRNDPPYYRCPDLLDECRYASRSQLVGCVIVVSQHAPADRRRGRAGPIIDRVTQRVRKQPVRVDYISYARIAIVLATARFVEALAHEQDVLVLSPSESPGAHLLY